MFSLMWIMPPRMRTRSAGRPAAESLGGGTGVRVGRGGRGRRFREGNDERVDDLNGQGNDQGLRANGGVERVNGYVEGANGGAPGFLTIIAQQLQNLLPVMLAQVGCSYKEFLAVTQRKMMGKVEYSPSHEMQKLETELWNHAMVGASHAAILIKMMYGLALPDSVSWCSNEAKAIQKAVQDFRKRDTGNLGAQVYHLQLLPCTRRALSHMHGAVNISGPSGVLDGTPTLPNGRDTTKTVETYLASTKVSFPMALKFSRG
ncbi:hypothetical protein Tco_0602072 [Tanacetum coccineum]